MKSLLSLVVLLAILGTCSSPVQAGFIATSTFDSGADGWTAHELGGNANSLTWHATGGNPGGYVNAVDIQDAHSWYWIAPAKFLGDVSSAYGGTLTFDLREHGTTASFAPEGDSRLTGGGITLVFDTVNDPTSNWTSYSVSLLETAPGWHLNSVTGAAPTQTQFQTVLTSLTSLSIRGEYISGADNGDLDNVFLNTPSAVAVPEPGSLALLGAGSVCLLGWYCRGRRGSRSLARQPRK